ncbi:putative HTH-type transcriptional regulator YtcD [Pedobacter sp. Bi27]|uniref:HxlR family transcriptional regulator n=1 Tax=Pedobacter ginsenosidimutans TaxID=687842 RepID=A0A0T5VI13_9SPHI|nr:MULTISPECIES: helix-turn-helix domain-containing protein [Pedobacter]KRT13220.1 HxlR family transcriptional regulator [Pedobacter ginsenosidimutans]MDQ0966092.1 DNA-binding HxlR family transcriptional regulator [Flavobacterium sp. W4I14]CAH0252587.1 putative HTH-type transcriptional regulator YtcD [Pedobacter sp. Bi27]
METPIKREATCEQELAAIRDSLEILGGKWKLRIMRYLNNHIDEKNTFKKIQREVEGISAKMLSKELRELEINLLVTRTVMETRPVTVNYAMTEYGLSVFPVTETLVDWGLNHREKIK